MKDYPLPKAEFDSIYSRVPRLSVEVVLVSDKGVYLTLRDIEPCKGMWHLPGGTVIFGESVLEAVKRVAKREMGITVTEAEFIDYLEYPSHYLHGLDHPFGVAFKVAGYIGELKYNKEAKNADWFTQLPENTHPDQDTFLRKHKFAQ